MQQPDMRLKNMPTRDALVTMVANQMMRGPRPGRPPGTPRQRELFKKRHEKQINFVIDELPRCSAAVAAVLTKCLIKYGEEKVAGFCRSLKQCTFQGPDDPVHQLWKFLQKHRGKDTVGAYKRTVCAARAYMEDRTLTALRPRNTDIFEWDEDWTVPDELLANWHPDRTPMSVDPAAVPGVPG